MNAYRLVLVAAVLTLGACNDKNPPELTGPSSDSVPILQRIHGTVVRENRFGAPSLKTDFGLLNMQGVAANAMASVDGAEVDVVGWLTGTSGLLVDSFEVLRMHGRPAIDGYLILDEQESYYVRLSNNNVVPLDNPPEELKAFVGLRIWLLPGTGEVATEFGAITIPASTL